jgi:translation initiation factor IF-1
MAAGVFRVELANGHRLVAHLPRRSVAAGAQIAPGVKVDLELSPFDLSEGTVVLSEKIKSL